MQTFLILSLNKEFIDRSIAQFKKSLQVSAFDFVEVSPESSLGIGDVRKIINQGIQLPFKGQNKLIVLRDFNLTTFEAQNALLKFLEEQPTFLTIILCAQSTQNILPTVISRSQLVKDRSQKLAASADLAPLLSMSKGERLVYLATMISSKDSSIKFIDDLSGSLENYLISDINKLPLSKTEIAKMLKKTEKARVFIANNVNYKLVVDILLLGFPKIQ